MGNYLPPQGNGAWENVPMGDPMLGPIYQDDFHGQNSNNFHDHGTGGKQKNNKKKNENDRFRLPVASTYEGLTIERAQAPAGMKRNWLLVGTTPMHHNQKELKEIARKGNLTKSWMKLDADQKAIINELVEKRNKKEYDDYAKWALADVHIEFVGGGWFQEGRARQIRIILKREDKDANLRGKRKSSTIPHFHPSEIIDLTKGKKKDGKDGKDKNKNKNQHDHYDQWDDHQNFNGGNNFNHPPPMMNGAIPIPPQHFDQHQFDNHGPQPMHDPYMHMNQGPMPPPMAPMVHDQYPPQPFHQRHNSNPPFNNPNPFAADPNVFPPGQFDHPLEFHNDDLFNPRERSRSRLRRRSSTRRNIDPHTTRKVERLHDEVDDLKRSMRRLSIQGGGHSSDDTYSDSIFSHDARNGDYSPPSSPRSGFSVPRGSLDGRGKGGNRSRYRSKRYDDVALVPGRAYPRDSGLRRMSSGRARRPKLHQVHTYDDYPIGRGVETGYVHDDRFDFERSGRRRSGYDSWDDGFGREYDRGLGRRNSIGGGGGRRYYD